MSTPATPIHQLSVIELAAAIQNGTLKAVDVTEHYLARIAEQQPTLNAFRAVFEDSARKPCRRRGCRRSHRSAGRCAHCHQRLHVLCRTSEQQRQQDA